MIANNHSPAFLKIIFVSLIAATECFATSPKLYPKLEQIFERDGYVILGTFIDRYEEEIVESRIHHDRGTEYIQRSYIGEIEIEAILPGLRNLSRENFHHEKFPVRFTKADLPQLKEASIFVVSDEAYGYVRPVEKENPELQAISDILKSGNYYYRPYKEFLGLWIGKNEAGKTVTSVSLEDTGFGAFGLNGGQLIRWKPYQKTITFYFNRVDPAEFDLILREKQVVGFRRNGITYRRPAKTDTLDTAFSRMLDMQTRITPGKDHPALGIWKVTMRHLSKTKQFQYVALNPDSSVYWFNSEHEFFRYGTWKAIAGEKHFFFKFDKSNHNLGEVISTDEGPVLMLTHFRGMRVPVDELQALSTPKQIKLQ